MLSRFKPAAVASLLIAGMSCSPGKPEKSPKPTPVVTPSPAASPSPSPSPARRAVPEMADAETAGRYVAVTETSIRSEGTQAWEYEWLGRTHQVAYRALVAKPEWRGAANSQIPESLQATAKSHIRAGELLRSLTRPVSQLPAWRIVEPPPAEELRSYYEEAESEFKIPWAYLAAIHLVESRMGRIRGTSPAGAQGPMQFIPSTWARYGRGDINDPRDSILAAGRYLDAAGAPEDMRRALYAYNHSDRYVEAITIYAGQVTQDERVFLAYYNWQVYVRTVNGDVLLEEGFGS